MKERAEETEETETESEIEDLWRMDGKTFPPNVTRSYDRSTYIILVQYIIRYYNFKRYLIFD